MADRREATKYTIQCHEDFLNETGLNPENRDDFIDAERGFIAGIAEPVPGGSGNSWAPETYTFLAKTGWIVIDSLTNTDAAQVSADLFYRHFGKRPITGLVYTHSHVDHLGGVEGIIFAKEAEEHGIPILAPEHFMEKAVSENILAGNAMHRRSAYMFGDDLLRDEKGNVDAAIGKAFAGSENISLIAPNVIIRKPLETHVIDGVEITFQLTPETEAPAEMTLFFPQLQAFCQAELCTQTLHNIYTIRGAETRGAKAWSGYIDDAIEEFGGKFDTVFSTHNWPVWGEARCLDYLKKQRDVYKYIHDQTLRLANHGYTMNEIAQQLKFPKSLSEAWRIRGNYGTLSHNAKADGLLLTIYFDFIDTGERYVLRLENSVLNYRIGWPEGEPEEVIKLSKKTFIEILSNLKFYM